MFGNILSVHLPKWWVGTVLHNGEHFNHHRNFYWTALILGLIVSPTPLYWPLVCFIIEENLFYIYPIDFLHLIMYH